MQDHELSYKLSGVYLTFYILLGLSLLPLFGLGIPFLIFGILQFLTTRLTVENKSLIHKRLFAHQELPLEKINSITINGFSGFGTLKIYTGNNEDRIIFPLINHPYEVKKRILAIKNAN